jgi:hypothetical protein
VSFIHTAKGIITPRSGIFNPLTPEVERLKAENVRLVKQLEDSLSYANYAKANP